MSADKLSITFHLSEGFAPFISIWTDAQATPLPKHTFSQYAPDMLKSKQGLFPSVSSGPFMMSESRPGDHYTVVRNPNYYRADEGLPYLDKIIFVPVQDENTILKNLQTGSITSSWFLDVSKMPAYRALTNYKLSINPVTVNFEMIAINFRNPILGPHREVRQAMAMAIDYASLRQTARQGTASPLCTPHGKGFNPGYQANAPCPQFDPAAANKLLDQNGWIKGADGVRAKNGQRLEFNYSTTSGKPWRQQDALIIQSNFKDIGIKLDIQYVPADTFFGTFLPSGKHDLAEYEQNPIYDPDESTVVACDQIPGSGGGNGNYSFYCNKQVDHYLTLEKSTADPVKRQDAFNHLHQIYLTDNPMDFPIIVLYGPSDPGIAKLTAHNYAPGPEVASETVNLWEWWCTNGKC
ncbi:MAG: peptide ABC transporter substrate-binding protein [Chloroflexi bacterium]|nr:peptide ABC transporter substrate-binding protein [Chloroflexota bacterium]